MIFKLLLNIHIFEAKPNAALSSALHLPSIKLVAKVSNILDTPKLFGSFLSKRFDFSKKTKKKALNDVTAERRNTSTSLCPILIPQGCHIAPSFLLRLQKYEEISSPPNFQMSLV